MSCFVLKQHDMAYFTDDLPQFAHVMAQLFPGAEYFQIGISNNESLEIKENLARK